MRIAILSQSYPPMLSGAALFAEKLAKHFSVCGHDILVLAASDQPYPYQVNYPNLSVERCRSYHNPLRASQRFALWPHYQVMKCLVKFSPDLIHIHDPFQLAISSFVFSHSRKIPVILTIHQLPWFIRAYLPGVKMVQHVAESMLWGYARWILRHCDRAVASTRTVAKVIYAHTGISPHIISCGVDLSTFHPGPSDRGQEVTLRAGLGIPNDVPIILHVGRLDKDKQVDRVVQAAALAMQKTSAHLLVVGDGTEKLKLMNLCAQLGVGERSHFPGFVLIENGLPALYQISTVFVTACEIETQGIVLLEAAASALPIVAVQATCLHEIVHEGQNGSLLRPRDIAGLANRLIELIQNPIRAHEMGQMGRLIVESHAAEKTFAAYESLYRTAIQEARLISSPKAIAPGRAARSGGSG